MRIVRSTAVHIPGENKTSLTFLQILYRTIHPLMARSEPTVTKLSMHNKSWKVVETFTELFHRLKTLRTLSVLGELPVMK